MEEEKPDIIHTVSPGSAGLCGLYCLKRLDIPLVSSFHTLVPQYGRYHMKKYLSDLFSFDERRLKKGVARKIIHNLIRNAILFINLYVGLPESIVESDWGYW